MVVRRRLKITGPALVFITITTKDRTPYFSNQEFALACLNQLRRELEQFRISAVGYVLMPTHLHGLFGFGEISVLSEFVHGFKRRSALRIKDILMQKGGIGCHGQFNLWKPRFDDLIITSEEQFRIKLNYIHQNPVKAGLAVSQTGWKYSSAGDYSGEKNGPLDIDRDFRWLI
ncbi:conserved hypothetical protein [Candidatus Zixiibacteriota bacterium]|nr:conserved hypothetical protein [candidate division Zixibacteria bacterium]